MSSRLRNIVGCIAGAVGLLLLVLAVFKYQSNSAENRATHDLSALGGTYTLMSADRARGPSALPLTIRRLIELVWRLDNPVTKVDLSVSAWPRAKSTFAALNDQNLACLTPLKKLESLSLRGMPITDEAMNQLTRFRGLKHLDLRETKVTPAGVAALRKELPDCSVEL